MADAPDSSRCPLCGQANQCGQCNLDNPGQPCWCFTISIAPETLDRIPVDARGKACLCARCANGDAIEAP